MEFSHDPRVLEMFPELVVGVEIVEGDVDPEPYLAQFAASADALLAGGPESALPQIQAWRRAFARMGLKPTQYRCAAEALLRRYRREGALPRIHPLVDLCNAVSLAYAVPVAAIDLDRVAGDLTVRPATGEEVYVTFGGEVEHPEPGEIIYADSAGRAHARRWTNRQSGDSAVSAGTTRALVVAEGLHETAAHDVPELMAALRRAVP